MRFKNWSTGSEKSENIVFVALLRQTIVSWKEATKRDQLNRYVLKKLRKKVTKSLCPEVFL